MRLDDYKPGDDIRDLGRGGGGLGRGGGGSGGGGGGLGGLLFALLPMLLGRKMGLGTIALLAIGGYFLLSSGMLNLAGPVGETPGRSGERVSTGVACDTAAEQLACNVFGSTHQVWQALIPDYRTPTLNFFTERNMSGCGAAQAAMGPFYCPADEGVYIDTVFFDELGGRFGASGDAAKAYVIAHEVGHHIQTITGISERVRRAQSRVGRTEANALQVRMELQADCLAGVWAARARNRAGQSVLEQSDFADALRAANAIGDDTLMRSAGQRPVPESFTHGTSQQRMEWLTRGIKSGDPRQCDSFDGLI